MPVACMASMVAIKGDQTVTGTPPKSTWVVPETVVLRPRYMFLPYLPSRLAPCIRPAVKSLVSPDSPDRRATKSRASVFEAKSRLFNPLSPCVPVCPGFLSGPGIAAASLSGPCPGPSLSGPAGPDPSYCAIWSDVSRFCPSRLQCRPAAILHRRKLSTPGTWRPLGQSASPNC